MTWASTASDLVIKVLKTGHTDLSPRPKGGDKGSMGWGGCGLERDLRQN